MENKYLTTEWCDLTNHNQCLMFFFRSGVSADAAHSSQLSRQRFGGQSESRSPLCSRQSHTDPRCPQGGAKSPVFPLQLSSADGTPREYKDILFISSTCSILLNKLVKWPPLVLCDLTETAGLWSSSADGGGETHAHRRRISGAHQTAPVQSWGESTEEDSQKDQE